MLVSWVKKHILTIKKYWRLVWCPGVQEAGRFVSPAWRRDTLLKVVILIWASKINLLYSPTATCKRDCRPGRQKRGRNWRRTIKCSQYVGRHQVGAMSAMHCYCASHACYKADKVILEESSANRVTFMTQYSKMSLQANPLDGGCCVLPSTIPSPNPEAHQGK